MQKEIFVNVNPTEVRVAIREQGDLVEFLVERPDDRRIVGNVYMGVVKAVLPGIQAAFVDIGMEKAGFLHVSDVAEGESKLADLENEGEGGPRRGRREPVQYPPIETLLKKGDTVQVQIIKEPIGTKGPRLSAQLSLPGKFCVVMPGLEYIGISRKILDRQERVRLKRIVQKAKPRGYATIVRTAGEGVEEAQLEHDITSQVEMHRKLQERAQRGKAPCRLHEEVGMVIGLVRDLFDEEVKRLLIDDEDEHHKLEEYIRGFAPELERRVLYYREKEPIFDHFGIETELEKVMRRQVWLKKGGYLLFDHTEALVAIDINTGKFVGKKSQAETIFQTNIYAAREVARQLRLRDIGGIIVIDFIDMDREGDKQRVVAELKNSMRRDKARNKIFDITPLGLVEMSRKRVRPSLIHFYNEDCSYCNGSGHILTSESLSNRVETILRRIAARVRERKFQVRVNPVLAHYLRVNRIEILRDLEEEYRVELHLLDDPRLHREHFEVTALETGRDLLAAVTR